MARSPKSPWSRGDIIGAMSLIISVLTILFGLTQPEIRRFIGLEHTPPIPIINGSSAYTPISSSSTNMPTQASTPTSSTHVGSLLYQADWSSGLNGWKPAQNYSSDKIWTTSGGMLVNNGAQGISPDANIYAPYQLKTANYIIETQIQLIKADPSCTCSSFGIFVSSTNTLIGTEEDGIYWIIDNNVNDANGSSSMSISNGSSGYYTLDTSWHTYRVEVKQGTMKVSIDGQMQLQTTNTVLLQPGLIGFTDLKDELYIRNFKVILS